MVISALVKTIVLPSGERTNMKNEMMNSEEKDMNLKTAESVRKEIEISDPEEKTDGSNEDNQQEKLTVSENRPQDISQSPARVNSPIGTEGVSSQRVFKKSSPNNKLTIYLNSRDLAVSDREMDRLQGVVVVDPDYLSEKKVFGQITLTFRYGREDEEVMGLKFCNEAVMTLAQLYPPHERAPLEPPSLLQDALMKRLGPHAHPFTLTLAHVAPPSVQLVPAKEYNGAPIGTNYDVRVYAAERPDEKLHRRSTVRMGIRVIQKAPYSHLYENPSVVSSLVSTGSRKPSITIEQSSSPSDPPHATVDKPFLLSEGRVELEASLDKATYHQGEPVLVTVIVRNNCGKTIRRLKVFVVQHVDVCMFSNGKFKNVVAMLNCKEKVPVSPWSTLNHTYRLNPAKGATKNWIALEDSFNRSEASLASTVTPPPSNPHDRNVFAIYVSYYVKVKILVGAMGGELSLKLPFTLTHAPQRDHEGDPTSIHTKDMESTEDPVPTEVLGTAHVELHQPRLSKPVCSFNIQKSPPVNYEDDIMPCPEAELT